MKMLKCSEYGTGGWWHDIIIREKGSLRRLRFREREKKPAINEENGKQ